LLWIEFEHDRAALAGLQAFRPARLGDGQHLTGCRISDFTVHRGLHAAKLDQLRNDTRDLVSTRVLIVGYVIYDLEPFQRLAAA